MAVNMKLAAFLDLVPCGLEKQQVLSKLHVTPQKTVAFTYLSLPCGTLFY
jgi:lipoate-protein ligase B